MDYFSDVYNNPEKYGIDLLHREECDIPLYIPHRKTTGFSEDKVESIMAEICRRVEIPQEYGLRFLMALVDRFGSKNIFEKANFLLYILGGKFRHLLKLN
ncbi:MAG: hypothetical protein GWO26_11240 [Phycisphaerae bacterium]|nr:hypothetical protein [Phycisphaerae bacterium]